MCGRMVLKANSREIAAFFAAEPSRSNVEPLAWEPDYNVTPAQMLPTCALDSEGVRKLVPMRWGLHASWQKERPGSRPLFNARSETVASKPSFRSAFRRRRALVPCNGFYEWLREEGPDGKPVKTPYYITDGAREMFAFAAIWEMWTDREAEEGSPPLLSMATLTMPADGVMAELHHRQPVRLAEKDWEAWLDPAVRIGDGEEVMAMALPSDSLRFHEVSREVNSGRAHGEALIREVA